MNGSYAPTTKPCHHSARPFAALDCAVELETSQLPAPLAAQLHADFSAFPQTGAGRTLRIEISPEKPGWTVQAAGQPPRRARSRGRLRWAVDKCLTIALQQARPDLFFVHAAVLARAGSAILLVGSPGAGKSTTAWALSKRGWAYASDELAPITANAQVWPYPRALWFKTPPPPPYRMPRTAVAVSQGLFLLPSAGLKLADPQKTLSLRGIFFLDEGPAGDGIAALQPSAAAVMLYRHALNALAHARAGLPVVAQLCQRVPGFAVSPQRLDRVCAAIERRCESLLLSQPLAR